MREVITCFVTKMQKDDKSTAKVQTDQFCLFCTRTTSWHGGWWRKKEGILVSHAILNILIRFKVYDFFPSRSTVLFPKRSYSSLRLVSYTHCRRAWTVHSVPCAGIGYQWAGLGEALCFQNVKWNKCYSLDLLYRSWHLNKTKNCMERSFIGFFSTLKSSSTG